MMRRIRTIPLMVALIMASLAVPRAARPQLMGLFVLERLSLLDTPGTGARPLSMGSAYTAVSDDVFALIYNPAGLVQLNKDEVSLGVHHSSIEVDQTYEGIRTSTSSSYTKIGHLAMAHPYPTYRGSMVFGLGVFRMGSSDLEYLRIGSRLSDLDGVVRNSFIQSGTIYQYRFGFGIELSPRIAVGATLVFWDESLDFTEEISFDGTADSSYIFIDEVSADMDGYSLELGLLLTLNQYVRAGLTFSTPARLYFDGEAVEYYDGTFPDGTEWTTDPLYYIVEDEYTIPMQFRGGLSFSLENFLVAADISYCDYSQTEYNGVTLIDEDNPHEEVLQSTLNYHIGAELTFPGAPLKLRGGYTYMPLKSAVMEELTHVYETVDEFALITEYDYFAVNNERQFFTFGVGGLVDRVLALDLGVTIGKFKRETPFLVEERNVTEVMVSAAYRF